MLLHYVVIIKTFVLPTYNMYINISFIPNRLLSEKYFTFPSISYSFLFQNVSNNLTTSLLFKYLHQVTSYRRTKQHCSTP